MFLQYENIFAKILKNNILTKVKFVVLFLSITAQITDNYLLSREHNK